MSHNGKSGVRHATDMVTPYALTAKENAVHYAQQAGAHVAPMARKAATRAKHGYASQVVPRVARAKAAAGPARAQATVRSQAAMAALRGDVSVRDIKAAVRRRQRRARTGRMMRRVGMIGLVAGGAFAAWKWWSGQNSPDWMAEDSPATEVPQDSGEH
ncbi:DUF5324 family protein [Streptomyces sp. RFCAC02]|uniref:DUF5324 family protein n=1 Tax=Streptomyces sp. RFCAC02 TaxID=2499143 RepID=UPI0023EA4E4C|nr:DUF5324 family protein [Streptomyces sp. RFCAC02]